MKNDWIGCPTGVTMRELIADCRRAGWVEVGLVADDGSLLPIGVAIAQAFVDLGQSRLMVVDEVMDYREAGVKLNLSVTEGDEDPIAWLPPVTFGVRYDCLPVASFMQSEKPVPEAVVVSPPPPAWVAMNQSPKVTRRGHSGSRRAHQGGTSHRRHR